MPRLRLLPLILFGSALAASALFAIRLAFPDLLRRPPPAVATGSATPTERPRFAVLGDSDSQSYHDTLMLNSDPSARGGPYRATTYQWTEALSRLRGDEVDLGEWGAWGTGPYRAFFDEAVGSLARTPPKQDYYYNFAVSGANCKELMGRKQRQAIRLIKLMDKEPQAWQGGVVLIRIGINDIGAHDVLDALSRDSGSPSATSLVRTCIDTIGDAVSLIRKQHPYTYIVLVGILSNADWSIDFANWQSGKAIANIDAGLDLYDNGLRRLAASDRHILFVDDRAWFRSLWGARNEQGRPAYKTLDLTSGWKITNTSGDEPYNAVLADGHAGVVWNVLWAQNLVSALNGAFGFTIRPITDDEVSRFLRPSFAAAPAPAPK